MLAWALALVVVGCVSVPSDFQGDVDIQEHKEFESVAVIEAPPEELEPQTEGDDKITLDAKKAKEGPLPSPSPESTNVKPKGLKKAPIKKSRTAKESALAKAKKKMVGPPPAKKHTKKATSSKKKKSEEKAVAVELLVKSAKTIEDRTGFIGRRPKVDPFYPGEEVTFDISYFGISAGTMTIRTGAYVKVNGRKAYHFLSKLKSNSVFSRMYSVDDVAETYVDFAEVVPLTYEVHLKESKRLQEGRAFFDWKNLKATKWEKKLTPDEGSTEKKITWDIDPYAQNVFSAPFYMRISPLFPGKKLAFRVADDGKNVTFTGEILRREVLETAVGNFKTIVLRPEIITDGNFKQEGDILFWLTDDDQKLIVGFEGKIKVGKIKATLIAIKRGTKPEN